MSKWLSRFSTQERQSPSDKPDTLASKPAPEPSELRTLTEEYNRNGRVRIKSTWAGTVWLVATPELATGCDGTTYMPDELKFMVKLSEHERQVTHGVKREFGGTIEPEGSY
jgi:hypothetical protein